MVRYLIRSCLVNLRNGGDSSKCSLAPGVLEWIKTDPHVQRLIDALVVKTYAEGEVKLNETTETIISDVVVHAISNCPEEELQCSFDSDEWETLLVVPSFKNLRNELFARMIQPGNRPYQLTNQQTNKPTNQTSNKLTNHSCVNVSG
jgi:hypothetical protein